jgi:signal transduction histidine kinase
MSPDWKMMFYLRGRDFIPDTEKPSGTWLQKYIHSDDQAYVMAAINEAIRTKSTFALEHRVRRVDGSLGWTFSRAIPIQNADGEIVEWFGAARDITERIRAELELQESRQELRALADRLINAEQEERKRISRELHDDLSQKLAMLAFDTGSLVQTPASSMEEIRERLRNFQTRVVQISQDVRQIAYQLHPSILEDLGLNSALSELCEEFSMRTGIVATCEQETPPKAMPMKVASCLYRVAQEALHNVSKHARASRVRLMIRGSPEGVRLGIRDDGAGFDLYAGRWRHGIGIVSMKERVRLVQGEFSIHSEPGLGTTVSIFVPLAKEVL